MIWLTRISLAFLIALCIHSAVGRTGPRDSIGAAKDSMSSFPGAVSRSNAVPVYNMRSVGAAIDTSLPPTTTTLAQDPSRTSHRAPQTVTSYTPAQSASQTSYGTSETITTYSSGTSGGYGGQGSGIGTPTAASGGGGYSTGDYRTGGYGTGGGGSGKAAGSDGRSGRYTEVISFGPGGYDSGRYGSLGASSSAGSSDGVRGYGPGSDGYGGYGPGRDGSMGASAAASSDGPVNAANLSNSLKRSRRQSFNYNNPDVVIDALLEVVADLIDKEPRPMEAARDLGQAVSNVGQAVLG